jgi:hypothetical protein
VNVDPPRNLTIAELWRIVQALAERLKDAEDAVEKLSTSRRWTRGEVMQFVSVAIAALVVVWTVYSSTRGGK